MVWLFSVSAVCGLRSHFTLCVVWHIERLDFVLNWHTGQQLDHSILAYHQIQIIKSSISSKIFLEPRIKILPTVNFELDKMLDEIVQKNAEKIQQEQIRALSGLMGIAMKEVRGKASGKKINQKLKEKIQKIQQSLLYFQPLNLLNHHEMLWWN